MPDFASRPPRRAMLAAGLGVALPAPALWAQTPRPAGKPLRVVTTFTIIQDMAQNVAGTVLDAGGQRVVVK